MMRAMLYEAAQSMLVRSTRCMLMAQSGHQDRAEQCLLSR